MKDSIHTETYKYFQCTDQRNGHKVNTSVEPATRSISLLQSTSGSPNSPVPSSDFLAIPNWLLALLFLIILLLYLVFSVTSVSSICYYKICYKIFNCYIYFVSVFLLHTKINMMHSEIWKMNLWKIRVQGIRVHPTWKHGFQKLPWLQ